MLAIYTTLSIHANKNEKVADSAGSLGYRLEEWSLEASARCSIVSVLMSDMNTSQWQRGDGLSPIAKKSLYIDGAGIQNSPSGTSTNLLRKLASGCEDNIMISGCRVTALRQSTHQVTSAQLIDDYKYVLYHV